MKPAYLNLFAMSLCLSSLCACLASRPDHFYILTPQPAAADTGAAPAALRATLKVTLPSLVDRPEIVINTSAEGVAVLEHERWAAPLTDLITQALARDIEQRRPNVQVGERNGGSAPGTYRFTVDIVQMTLRPGSQAGIEAQWRLTGASGAAVADRGLSGGVVVSAPLAAVGYTDVARALSECLGILADRLAEQLPR